MSHLNALAGKVSWAGPKPSGSVRTTGADPYPGMPGASPSVSGTKNGPDGITHAQDPTQGGAGGGGSDGGGTDGGTSGGDGPISP